MINLETEIREQPRTIPNAIDLNLETIREIVKKAKDKGVKHIYFAARGTSDHACVYAQYLFGILLSAFLSRARRRTFSLYLNPQRKTAL